MNFDFRAFLAVPVLVMAMCVPSAGAAEAKPEAKPAAVRPAATAVKERVPPVRPKVDPTAKLAAEKKALRPAIAAANAEVKRLRDEFEAQREDVIEERRQALEELKSAKKGPERQAILQRMRQQQQERAQQLKDIQLARERAAKVRQEAAPANRKATVPAR